LKEKILIYTDGASRGNPGPGGYGIVMIFGTHRREISGGYKLTTNNRMELLAVIHALEILKTDKYPVIVYSDSRYVVDAINKRWVEGWVRQQFRKTKNPDLWIRLLRQLAKYKVEFVWVKGHASNPENNRCDELAVSAALSGKLDSDSYYEKEREKGDIFEE
jgi:ribonuclease HI